MDVNGLVTQQGLHRQMGMLPLPPGNCLNYPVAGFIRKGLHNQVVKVDKVERAMGLTPHGDGGKPNVRLRRMMGLEYSGECSDTEVPELQHMQSSWE